MNTSRAFTLIEVVIAVLVLAVGLGAALSLVLNGMQWARDVRRNTLAVQTVRSVLEEPRLIDESYDPTSYGVDAEGYVNGFYVVRSCDPVTLESFSDTGNAWTQRAFTETELDDLELHCADVTIKIYEGVIAGNTATGELILEQTATLYRQLR